MPDFPLSDHAYVSRNFEFKERESGIAVSLACASWNTADKYFSIKNHSDFGKKDMDAYSNNPYNADEPPKDYERRKRAQFERIANNITGGDDVVALQEVDFLTSYSSLTYDFMSMLRERNYGLVLTERPKDPHFAQQPMAMIYNMDKFDLDPMGSAHIFPTPSEPGTKVKYRGYQTTLIHKESGMRIVVANIHLPYGDDHYTPQIVEYQNSLRENGTPSIVVGDANRPPPNIPSSYTDKTIATNFSCDPKTGMLTNEEAGDTKAFDQFFAVAPEGMDLHTEITDRSEQVSIGPDQKPQFRRVLKDKLALPLFFNKESQETASAASAGPTHRY